MFANQRGGALQIGLQTRLCTWPQRMHNNTCIYIYIIKGIDFVIVCKPAWWGTSSRIPDTAGYMAGTAK